MDPGPPPPPLNRTDAELELCVYGFVRSLCFDSKRVVPDDVIKLCLSIYVSMFTVSFEEAVEILVNGSCAFGYYHEEVAQWRTAVLIMVFSRTRRITIRFTGPVCEVRRGGVSTTFCIRQFPTYHIIV